MTLAQFKGKHGDMIKQLQPAWDSLERLANGESLFYVDLSRAAKPIEQRKVLWAGHVMTAGMDEDRQYLLILRLTTGGNAVIDKIMRSDLAPDGHAMLFYAEPIPAWDPRNRKTWADLNQV